MPLDLLVYAAVATVLMILLFRVLGTRADEGPVRPNPFVEQPHKNPDTGRPTVHVPSADVTLGTPAGDASAEAQQALFQMALTDKTFDANQFVANAKEAYRIVVESFAAGDRATLKDLLAPHVYKAFEDALNERERSGETMTASVKNIRIAEIASATIVPHNNEARITMRFTSDQTRVTRDKQGVILSGDEKLTQTMVDAWTFARLLGNRDPRWLVVETEDGDASDGPL